MTKEERMDRERFAGLVEAYGADFRRWPAETRASAAAFAAQDADASALMAEARALDATLDVVRDVEPPTEGLAARILAFAPRVQRPVFDRRAMVALAACAVFGVLIGYGAGLNAPTPAAQDDSYFTQAFDAPFDFEDEG